MELILVDFRCHAETRAWFPASSLSLLQAPSGGGKSTFLAALRWALYGKIQNTAPISNPKAKTQVWARFWPGESGPAAPDTEPTLEVFRQGRPSLFQFTASGVTYEGTEAEAETIRHFGTAAMYAATSCMEQGERAHLLALPQAERLDLLHHLSYLGDDPGYIIERLRAEISSIKTTQGEQQAIQDQEQKRFKQLEMRLTGSRAPLDLQLLERQIRQEAAVVATAEKALHAHQQQQTRWLEQRRAQQERERQLSQAQADLVRQPALSQLDAELAQLQTEISTAEAATLVDGQLRERDRLRTALAALPPPSEVVPTSSMLKEAQRAEAARTQHEGVAKRLGIAYDRDIISAQIELIQDQLHVQPILAAYDTWQAAPKPEGETNMAEKSYRLEEARAIHQQLLDARDVQRCPCAPDCPHSLRIRGGRIVSSAVAAPTETELATARQAVEAASAALTEAKSRERQQAEAKRLHTIYTSLAQGDEELDLTAPRLTSIQQQALQRRLGLLETIEVVDEPPVSSAILSQQIEAHRLKDQLQTVEKSLPEGATYSTGTPIADLRRRQAKLQQNRDQVQRLQAQVSTLQRSQIELPSEPLPDTDLRITLTQAQTNLRKSQDLRAQQAGIIELQNFRADIEKREVELAERATRLAELITIHATARTLAQDLLDTMLVAINDSLADIISRLFDDPIEVQLRLQRQLKARDATKAEVGLTIRYRGGEYNNLTQLSGGEADRVSLAVLLALSQRSTVPILFLDEVTAALNEEYRERVFQVVRDFSAGKAVVCIGHEEVAGHFDHTIELTA